MQVRKASHAGSWYSADKKTLSSELDGWLEHVQNRSLPVPNARVIIAPHAGYSYSGSTAAWAYKALDVSKAKRVFLLGPSHHVYLKNVCALSGSTQFATPLGNLEVDLETTSELFDTSKFAWMQPSAEEDEHSLEMHLPYIYKVLSRTFNESAETPKLIPIVVGATSPRAEKMYGEILAPYLADPSNVFVVSSDFAHWGLRFSYTYYLPSGDAKVDQGKVLKSSDKGPFSDHQIFESIEKVDKACLSAIESGSHERFLGVLDKTGNTVCGQHAIGVIMAAMEHLARPDATFKFIQYTRSSDCKAIRDSSVSYASGYAVIN